VVAPDLPLAVEVVREHKEASEQEASEQETSENKSSFERCAVRVAAQD
jgi:hypothetical protein